MLLVDEVKRLRLKSFRRSNQRHRITWNRFSQFDSLCCPYRGYPLIRCNASTSELKVRTECGSNVRSDQLKTVAGL